VTVLLPTRMVAKPWGKDSLPAPFEAPDGQRIGEVWFESPAALDALLVKYIFTSEALSVQVHPSDVQAKAVGGGAKGKAECWLVVDAEPGAALGIGFREPIDHAAMRAAAMDGSIEHLLAWHPVSAGDFFYIPANTVHAIGGGISLIEIQQNSDITYRLYDYGRPRDLHLDLGLAVASGTIYPTELRKEVPAKGAVTLADGPVFRLDRLDGHVPDDVRHRYRSGPALVIPLDAPVTVAGETIRAGECGWAPELGALQTAADGRVLITQPV
jgi:mannose-6-phosphate isomerase